MTKVIDRKEVRRLLSRKRQATLVRMYYAQWSKNEIVEDIISGNDDQSLTELLQKNDLDFRVSDRKR